MKLVSFLLIALIALNSVSATSTLTKLSSCILGLTNPCTTAVVATDPSCSSNLAYYGVCIGACGATTSLSSYSQCAASCTTSDQNLSTYATSVQSCISKSSGTQLVLSAILLISLFIVAF
ncbi:hypothetical protein ABPG74_009376 [Tetrahymena malaccensis]